MFKFSLWLRLQLTHYASAFPAFSAILILSGRLVADRLKSALQLCSALS